MQLKRKKLPLLLPKDIQFCCDTSEVEQAPLVGNWMTNILKDSSSMKDALVD